jgi:hypothetical protein
MISYSSCKTDCITPTWKVGWLRSLNAMVYEEEPNNAVVRVMKCSVS